jgi:CHC2 zinc finger
MDLLTLVSQDVDLRKAGREYVARCVLHADKTPSLYVNDAKGLWHCFGCGAGGDAIEWLRKVRGLSFPAARRLVEGEEFVRQTTCRGTQRNKQKLHPEAEAVRLRTGREQFASWKAARYLQTVERIGAVQALLHSLQRAHRMRLSWADHQRLDQLLAEQHDRLQLLTEELDRYDLNPLVHDEEVREEWHQACTADKPR